MNKKIIFIVTMLTITASIGCKNKNNGSNISSLSIDPDNYSETYKQLWDIEQESLRTGNATLDFYNFNDLHGATDYFENGYFTEPGIRKLSTYIKEQKVKNPDGFILTSSGDMWQGSADSNITKGALVVDWMNLLNFDAQAIGNHEFDWTVDTINENQKNMNFPLLACNIIDKNTSEPVEWVQPYTTLTRKGVHIGVVGAIGEGQTADILAANVKDLKFDNPTNYVVKWSNYLLDNGADIILYLLHDTVKNISSSVANAINVGFSGHSHSGENEIIGKNKAHVVQAYCNGRDIGHICLTYSFKNKACSTSKSELLDTRYIKNSDDPETNSLYQKYLDEQISAIKNRVVGHTNSIIPKSSLPNIYNQYAYKYYLDELEESYSIFAVETNNVRSDILAGDITYGDVYKSFPFDNALCLIKVSGYNFKNVLCTYESATFYMINEQISCSYNNASSYVPSDSEYYYVLTIDYIATSTFSSSKYEIIKIYETEDALPRNIVSKYICDYPSNIN